MELYQRIKMRRLELGMSQEELAFKLGYKSRSSINKIEMGDNDIPQSKILAFANALDTTPSYLMGIDTQNDKNQTNLSSDRLLDRLDSDTMRQLNDINISKLNKYAQNLLAIQQMEEEPVLMAAHHDNLTEEQQLKINKDLDILKRPTL